MFLSPFATLIIAQVEYGQKSGSNLISLFI